MPSIKKKSQLRLRVFAGPNGSGKTTIIDAVRAHKVKNIPIDFGIYINADDIASKLRENKFAFREYGIKTTRDEFVNVALDSGLVNEKLSEANFKKSFRFSANKIYLVKKDHDEQLAQIIADFARKKLLSLKKKFSFETVFSHPSKLEIMRQAKDAGYKVYLYFVSTESPEINKYRVKLRKEKGGHDVPDETIERRYYRALDLLYEASQLAYQAYFFDNTEEGKDFTLFAHFKVLRAKKRWDKIDKKRVPEWFKKYYSAKIPHK